MGRIQRESAEVQRDFIILMCKYWHKECVLPVDEAALEIGEETLQRLTSKKIVGLDGGFISIAFLDEQMSDIQQVSKKNSDNARKRWDSERNATASDRIPTPMPNDADKIREDKNKIKDKDIDKKKKVVSKADPLIQSFNKKYFEWFKQKFNLEPQYDGSDGKAIKKLVDYFKKNSAGDPLDSWVVFLGEWDRLDDFWQQKTRIREIGSNIQSMVVQMKSKNKMNKYDQARAELEEEVRQSSRNSS